MPEEADYAMTDMAHNLPNNSRYAPMLGDESLLVKFETRQKQDKAESQAAGRPIFKDVVYIDIRSPGNRAGGVSRPVRDWDKTRFPKHWEAFQARHEMPQEGTPLEEWPPIPRSLVEEFKHYHIQTVEQLADVSDGNLQNFMGGQTWKAKAQAFLAAAGDQKQAQKIEKELASRDEKIAELSAKLDSLVSSLEKKVDPL
jgi:hypothetical protein